MRNHDRVWLIFMVIAVCPIIITAQRSENAKCISPPDDQEKHFMPSANGKPRSVTSPAYFNEINAKAVREFTRSYKEVSGEKWYIVGDGYAVSFIKDSIRTHVFYSKRGRYQQSIRYYFKNRLPNNIRHLIRSTYYDFSIYFITEIHSNDQVLYVIKIEDAISWKMIKVLNEEIEEMETLLKTQ